MSDKLIQKHLVKGTVEFVIDDEDIHIYTTPRFGHSRETLTVRLSVLNPEPVINKSQLEFVSRVNGEALVSLSLAKPSVEEFNAFVNNLKQKAASEYSAFIGMSAVTRQATPPGNVDEEPPEFGEASTAAIAKTKQVKVENLHNAIELLETYVQGDDIEALLKSLKALADAPNDPALLTAVAQAFNGLESQGAVLTYAPYINIMLSDDPFSY